MMYISGADRSCLRVAVKHQRNSVHQFQMADSSRGRGRRGGRGRGRAARVPSSVDPQPSDRYHPTSTFVDGTPLGDGVAPPTQPHVVGTQAAPSSSTPMTGPSSSSVQESHGPFDRRILLIPRGDNDFLPAKGPSDSISKILRCNFDGPRPTWKAIPGGHRDQLFQEFKKEYRWDVALEGLIRDIFEHKGSLVVKNLTNKLRKGKNKGKWVDPEIRRQLNQYGATEKFQEIQATARRNRASNGGACAWTGGSKSAAAHYDELKAQKQRAPTAMELVERTKKLKSGTWVNDKACNYAVGFNEKKDDAISRSSQSQDEALTGDGPSPPISVDDNAIYLEVVTGRNKKGHVYGLGHLGGEFIALSFGTPAPSYTYTVPQEQFNQIQDTITQLNAELREKSEREQQMANQIAQLTQAHQQLMQTSIEQGQTLQLVLEQIRIQTPVAQGDALTVVPPAAAPPVLPPATDAATAEDDQIADVGGTDTEDDWIPPPPPHHD